MKQTRSVLIAQKYDNTSANEWIKQYIRSKLAHSAAIKIQDCWKAYRIRRKWGGYFHRRIWSRHDALLRIFLGWCGYASHNMEKFNFVINRL